MMKTALRINNMSVRGLVALLCLMAGMTFATAAPAPVMTPVTIPSCVVSSGTTLVDFGRQSRGQLKDVPGGMSPGSRMMTVSLVCNVVQLLKLRVSGATSGNHFLFGDDGQLTVTAVRAQLDGKPVQLQRKNDAGRGGGLSGPPLRLLPDDVMVPVVSGQPAEGLHLTVMLQLVPLLGPKASRPTQQAEKQQQLSFSREP